MLPTPIAAWKRGDWLQCVLEQGISGALQEELRRLARCTPCLGLRAGNAASA